MESQDQRSKSERPFRTNSQVIDSERNALVRIDPDGFQLRPPPPPHTLTSFITPDSQLFQTIHMGCTVVEPSRWTLVIDGLVQNTVMLSLSQLQRLPHTTVTSFHECYGSPLKPPVANVMRVGNVVWKGVRLRDVLKLAQPLSSALFVWAEGLDHGTFGGRYADRYQKDLPLEKAMSEEVLLAWEINGEPLSKERGGPVRLVVPGWFGTNSTKWVCKLSLKNRRAESIYTTVFYNEIDPTSSEGSLRPVWQVEPNSIRDVVNIKNIKYIKY